MQKRERKEKGRRRYRREKIRWNGKDHQRREFFKQDFLIPFTVRSTEGRRKKRKGRSMLNY